MVSRSALSKRKAANTTTTTTTTTTVTILNFISKVFAFRALILPLTDMGEFFTRTTSKSITDSSHQKIYQILYSCKDKTNANLKADAHRILCECRVVYIGETRRNLIIRQKEHLDCYIKENCENSTIAKQAWMCDRKVNWDRSAVLAPIDKYFVRKTRESFEIAKHWTMPQEGKPLKNIWTYLFRPDRAMKLLVYFSLCFLLYWINKR